jgi:uncharacterized protein
MFLVGGGILVHGVPALHAWIEDLALPLSILVDAVIGIAAGAAIVAVARGARRGLSGGRRPR